MRVTIDFFTRSITGILTPATRTFEAASVAEAESRLRESLGLFLDRICGSKVQGQDAAPESETTYQPVSLKETEHSE